MTPIVGVFKNRPDAEQCIVELRSAGIAKSKIHLLTHGSNKEELAAIPTINTEQPGILKAIGAVVGGTMGLAGGLEVAEVFLAMIPGIGAVIVFGLSGTALLTALGAIGGGAIGGAFENTVFKGLPEEELYVYKDALRTGRSVLIVTADSGKEDKVIREKLTASGAESIDQAREDWWLGLRDVEKEHYNITKGNFDQDEREFRAGFEASYLLENQEKSYEQALPQLTGRYPQIHSSATFRDGYQRGQLQQTESKKV
ncbi:MAG: hypothetical protein ACRD4P_16815 [Bryobacteraceae bacterium]